MNEADRLLAAARESVAEGLEDHALRRYRKLDELLSSGKVSLPWEWARALPGAAPPVDLWKESPR